MTGSLQTIRLAGQSWGLADPCETMGGTDLRVPAAPALYLWLRRETPGPSSRATDQVLFVGKSRNLRRRLRQLTSGIAKSDLALQAVFDFQIAPRLDSVQLKQLIVQRKALALAQMWIRDQVMFAWLPWHGQAIGGSDSLFAPDVNTASASMENAVGLLVEDLHPLMAVQEVWAQHRQTDHEDHDLTLSLIPVGLPDWTRPN